MSASFVRGLPLLGLTFVVLVAITGFEPAVAKAKSPAVKAATPAKAAHKVAIQVNDNDPRLMTLALNNASNVAEYYKSKGQPVSIEIVAYGPGLHMLRSDTSPVKSRIAEMSLAMPQLAFKACGNTQANMAKQEGKPVPIVTEASVVPSGVVRLMELQEAGYTYIKP